MVDYNIAIPQQQLFQAPDFTQNAMRMQQAQLQEMQMQELARKNAEARNTQRLYANPNFDQFSPEGIRQLGQAGGYKAGIAAAAAARQNENLQRQTALTNAGLEKTRLEIGAKEYDIAQDRLAAIAPGDAKSYAEWDRVHGAAYRANGVNLPTLDQWAQDTNGQLKGHMVATSQSVRERAAKEPVRGVVGNTPVVYANPNDPTVATEVTLKPAGLTYPVGPERVASMNAAAGRTGGEPIVQDSGQGARAAIGAPVANALAAAQPGAAPIQPPVGNAMAASPSPYGAPISAGAFVQQQKAQEDQRVLALELAKKRGEAQVAQEQALPKAKSEDIAKREVGFEKATTNVRTAAQELDEQIRLVNELRTHPGLTNITGTLYGRTPNLSQSAVNAQSLLDTVKEKGKLTALLNLKEAGGTLGQVSNAEGEGLRQSIAPLAQRQDTETFQRRLNDYAAKLTAAKAKLTGAYEDTYAYKGAKAPASSFTVADPTGKVHTFLSQQAADQFKQAAGL